MTDITLLEKITAINEGLSVAFGEADSPFEIATRLLLFLAYSTKCLPLCYFAPMNKDPNVGHAPVDKANNHSQLFNERRDQLEALFRMAHERIQENQIGRFNRNEIYEDRLESIYRGSDQ